MSKQSEAKERQGYTSRPIPRVCMNCVNFDFDIQDSYGGYPYVIDVNQRCTLGNFSVKKMASCNEFKLKVSE